MNRSCEERMILRLMDLHPKCERLAVGILGYAVPFLAVIVTTVNILIVVIFTKPHIRSHTTFILTLIACADMVDILCPTVVFTYHYMLGHYKEFLTCRQIEWAYILGEICVDMFNMLSLWLTVLLAFIRCRCIKFPFVARNVHSFKKIVVYILCIFALVITVHTPSFFIFDFQTVNIVDSKTNETKTTCGVMEADGMLLKACSKRKFHVLTETLLDSIVPCVILLYFNFVMVITLRRANQSRSSLRQKDLEPSTDNQDCVMEEEKSRKRVHCEIINLNRSEHMVTSCGKCRQCGSCFVNCNSRRKRVSSDIILDKLDKESRRTSWLIFVVSSIIVVHEIPLAVANAYALVTHRNVPLPIAINGCLSVILLLWQFITYPVIFIIYACMSGAFRSELWRILTFMCKYNHSKQPNEKNLFASPCSVRKTISKIKAGSSREIHQHNESIMDSDSCPCSNPDCEMEAYAH